MIGLLLVKTGGGGRRVFVRVIGRDHGNALAKPKDVVCCRACFGQTGGVLEESGCCFAAEDDGDEDDEELLVVVLAGRDELAAVPVACSSAYSLPRTPYRCHGED